MNYKNIKVEKRENYAIIEIANNKNNSLDQKTLNEIGNATQYLNKIKEINVLVLLEDQSFFPWVQILRNLRNFDSKKQNNKNFFPK